MSGQTVAAGAQPTNRTIFTADNLPVLRGIDSETIDLIYLDPPFNTGKQWHAPIGSDAEGASFNDIWAWDDLAEAEGETLATSVKRQWLNALHIESPIRAVVETAESTAGEEMGAYLAFMAMRLVEMHRVLKPTGSIYLHCDPTASHYLKLLLDSLFGRQHFRNEIVWCYTGPGNVKRWFKRKHDTILFYVKSNDASFNADDLRLPYTAAFTPARGLHRTSPVDFRAAEKRHDLGKVPTDWWADGFLSNVSAWRSELTGYPTQKPLALLERIVTASSRPGDAVLDPFCGCATACVAAEKLGRRWIGIDVSELAVLLCDDRIQTMQNETGQTNFGIPYHDPVHRTDVPERTDSSALVGEMPIDLSLPKEAVKQRLYEQQSGICNGCERHFPPEFADLMDLDHIKPKSRGGLHTWPNVQLLCRTCNVRKGSGTMAQLRKRLSQDVA
ncbi:MAG: DNA methyltransferase [Chloroflexi bacterium]|nr:DNA methyltransferase [Chloroflexota bacterium]